jgi:DNA repair exonuclease SbcCD ATPase subunit
MIVFEQIKWKNFLSTGNNWTIVHLNKNPTTLIVGENGAGKSTILDALTFALFGKPYRNINKPQLMNSINNKDCMVELRFAIGDRRYILSRGMKPNVFEIYVDGVLLNQDASSKDYQEMLEKTIIKMNYKSFTQIVILGSASFTPFMQLSAADRRAVIEDLLDIQIFTNMNLLVKEKLSSLKTQMSELKIKLDSVKEKIDLHKSHIDEMKRNNQEAIEKKQAQILEHQNSLTELENNKQSLEAELVALVAKLDGSEDAQEKKQKLLAYEVKIDTNKNKLEKEIRFYNDNDNCPTCKQNISPTYKTTMLSECNKTMDEYNHGLEKLKEQKNAILQRISNYRAIEEAISSVEANVSTARVSISHTKKYVRVLEDEIETLANTKAISTNTKEQSEKLVEELTSIVAQRKSASEEKQYYDIASVLLKDGGIKAKIVKQYLPIINKMVNKYLASMDFFVNFNIDEEFKETIKSRHRDDFSYESFSEGEKQKIDLSLLLTWRAVARMKNSVNTNLLILDETFDSSLDNKGTDSLLQILYTLPENTNVFVITHKDQLHDKFSHSLRFEKRQNFSRIV